MTELESARAEINNIDKQMAELFERRMEMSAQIGDYKRRHALPVLDLQREHELKEKNLSYIKNDTLKPLYIDFLTKLMALSREYQSKITGGDER